MENDLIRYKILPMIINTLPKTIYVRINCILRLNKMKKIKETILECDIFAHGSLQRYKQEQSYRTFAGGVVSILFILLFVVMFSNLVFQTFRKNIIVSQTSVAYDDDPTYSEIIASTQFNHMFAIGISNMDLSSSQRYFDIVMIEKTHTKNGSITVKTSNNIPLEPCRISHWQRISQSIQNNFNTLSFNRWLCPSINQLISLQGKFTSDLFKYAQVIVSRCTANPLFPNTTCRSDAQVQTFLKNNTQFTFNYYLVNPVINPNEANFVSYYLEDSNYFSFDTTLGVNANLFFSDYRIQTDTTFLPWQEYQQSKGTMVQQTAFGQIFQISNTTQYFKFNLRKASHKLQISRSFQKIDQTFSFIGGLFGTFSLLLSFLRLYSKYNYELDLGDKIFKQNHGGSFGSQNFNFILFIGYLFFNLFTKFSVILNWKTMKRFHKCRMECQKQLNIDLLFKKINHFQEITKILLQDHQLKMILMTPKQTINEAKLNRKKYLIKNIIYHQLQQKAGDVNVESSELKNRLRHFFRQEGSENILQFINQDPKNEQSLKCIQEDIIRSFKKIKLDVGDSINPSKKIIQRINLQDLTTSIFGFINAKIEQKSQNQLENTEEQLQTKVISIAPKNLELFQFLQNSSGEDKRPPSVVKEENQFQSQI